MLPVKDGKYNKLPLAFGNHLLFKRYLNCL
jgi:hypothetical protein